MKPLYLKTSILLCTLFLWAGVSIASPIFVGDSSNLTGNQAHQDKITNINELVNLYNTGNLFDLPAPLTLLGKWKKNSWDSWNDDTISKFTGDFTGNSGSWSVGDGWDATVPLYYSLKAGSTNSGGGFELWYTNGLLEGDWDTSGLANKGLSHISFWTVAGNIPVDPPNPVPEPGTLALVGLGLVTIAGYRRKRLSS